MIWCSSSWGTLNNLIGDKITTIVCIKVMENIRHSGERVWHMRGGKWTAFGSKKVWGCLGRMRWDLQCLSKGDCIDGNAEYSNTEFSQLLLQMVRVVLSYIAAC